MINRRVSEKRINEQRERKRTMKTLKDFTPDEVVMLRFLEICQPSLNPASYEAVEEACIVLGDRRRGLTDGSLKKCLEFLDNA